MNSILTFLTSAMKPKGPHEFAGPCPLCGGDDRFIVWPGRPRGGAFLCRKCGAAAVLDAVSRGDLTPGEANALASLVGSHGKAIELAELEDRLAALEAQMNADAATARGSK